MAAFSPRFRGGFGFGFGFRGSAPSRSLPILHLLRSTPPQRANPPHDIIVIAEQDGRCASPPGQRIGWRHRRRRPRSDSGVDGVGANVALPRHFPPFPAAASTTLLTTTATSPFPTVFITHHTSRPGSGDGGGGGGGGIVFKFGIKNGGYGIGIGMAIGGGEARTWPTNAHARSGHVSLLHTRSRDDVAAVAAGEYLRVWEVSASDDAAASAESTEATGSSSSSSSFSSVTSSKAGNLGAETNQAHASTVGGDCDNDSVGGGGGGGAILFERSDDGKGWRRRTPSSSSSLLSYSYTSSSPLSTSFANADRASSLSLLLGSVEARLHRDVIRHFLPEGYPSSVSSGYKSYAIHSFLASTCGSAAFVLSTQSLLLAVGIGGATEVSVGTAAATAAPLSAALNWVLKDGIGQLGGVLFASRLGRGAYSTVDSDPKRWRTVAAMALDSAALLELTSPAFPGYFLAVASLANVGKNIGFLASGASRAALHQSLCRRDNLGDVTAKAGSQSVASSLIGTAIGIGLSPFVNGGGGGIGGDAGVLAGVSPEAMGFFVALSACHQWGTYRALRSVALDSFDRQRLHLVLDEFVRDVFVAEAETEAAETMCVYGRGRGQGQGREEERRSINVLSPSEVAERESFLPFSTSDGSIPWLTIGCGLSELCPQGPDELLRLDSIRRLGRRRRAGNGGGGVHVDDDADGERYLLNCRYRRGDDAATNVRLVFLRGADGADVVRGVLHAHFLRRATAAHRGGSGIALDRRDGGGGGGGDANDDLSEAALRYSWSISSRYVDVLLDGMRGCGWRVDDGSICVEGGSTGRRLAVRTGRRRDG